jgi:hypothetical protein
MPEPREDKVSSPDVIRPASPVHEQEPQLDPATRRLFLLITAALVTMNAVYFSSPRPVQLPRELTDEYDPPRPDTLNPPWSYETDPDLSTPHFLDELSAKLDERRRVQEARLDVLRADALIGMGEFVEAELRARSALSLDPSNRTARERLIHSLLQQAKLEQAREEARAYIQSGGDAKKIDPRARP